MEPIIICIAALAGIGVGAGSIFAYNKKNQSGGKAKAEDLVRKAKNEAADIVLRAKTEAAEVTQKAQAEESERRKELNRSERRLNERETLVDEKLDQLEKKQEKLVKQAQELEELKGEVRQIRDKQSEKLEKIANLTKAQAREKIMTMTEHDIRQPLYPCSIISLNLFPGFILDRLLRTAEKTVVIRHSVLLHERKRQPVGIYTAHRQLPLKQRQDIQPKP